MPDNMKDNTLNDIKAVISRFRDEFKLSRSFASVVWGEDNDTDKYDVRKAVCAQFLLNAVDLIDEKPRVAGEYIDYVVREGRTCGITREHVNPLLLPIARSLLKKNEAFSAKKFVDMAIQTAESKGKTIPGVLDMYPQISSVLFINNDEIYTAGRAIDTLTLRSLEQSGYQELSDKWNDILCKLDDRSKLSVEEKVYCFKSMSDELEKIKAQPVWLDNKDAVKQRISDLII